MPDSQSGSDTGCSSRTLVAGVGSTILSDDGVGVRVVERLRETLDRPDVDVLELGTAGLSLLDEVSGYDRLILVDAIVTGAKPGTVHVLGEDEVATTVHLGASHEADLQSTLAWGRRAVGEALPQEVHVVAVEAADLTTFSETLTPAVEGAVSDALDAVLRLLP